MDQARNQVVWCRGRMGGVDVPHELVKVMSGILTSYPTKTRMSAVGPLNFYFVTSHPIPFTQKNLGTYHQTDTSLKQTSYAKLTRADAVHSSF